MDTQNACLSKIVLDGDLLPFIESKITRTFFPDEKHARIWDMVLDHYREYNKAPSVEAIHKAYPHYSFGSFPEPTTYYLNQLKQDRKKVILINTIQETANRMTEEDGPSIGDDLEVILRHGMAEAAHEITQGRDTDFYLSYQRIMERLRERKANPSMLRGITTGLAGIDHLTGGLQKQQLITMVGTPKAGKSSMLLQMAFNAHRNGNPVLFVTFEMSTEEQEDRLISLLSGVGLTKILSGSFDMAEEERIEKALAIRKDMSGFTITSDITSAITVSGVQAKVQQYQPNVVIIDGVYLMDDESGHDKGTPQALTSITRGFKRMAQSLELPVIISTQAMLYRSKGGLKMDSIGYSSSFAQDSDIVFGVEADDSVLGVSRFKVIASRSSPKGEAIVRFDWSQGLIQEISTDDYEQVLNKVYPAAGTKKAAGPLDALWDKEDEESAA